MIIISKRSKRKVLNLFLFYFIPYIVGALKKSGINNHNGVPVDVIVSEYGLSEVQELLDTIKLTNIPISYDKFSEIVVSKLEKWLVYQWTWAKLGYTRDDVFRLVREFIYLSKNTNIANVTIMTPSLISITEYDKSYKIYLGKFRGNRVGEYISDYRMIVSFNGEMAYNDSKVGRISAIYNCLTRYSKTSS